MYVAKPPRWTDESAVADWVIENLALPDPTFRTYEKVKAEVRELIREKKLCGPVADRKAKNCIIIDVMAIIDDAVTGAEHGNFRDLAILLFPNHPFNNLPDGQTVRALLPPKAWWLIADQLLSGRYKAKRGRGRPAKDSLKRWLSPVHGAANHFPCVKQFLLESYPEQKASQIHDRALYIAARHHEIKQGTLSNYLRRPRNDRRRVPNRPDV